MTQIEALNILKMGHSAFLTGQAGAGKTYVLNQYIEWLRAHSIPVAICASTGIAATHIGGSTLHSFSGLEIHDALDDRLLDKILQKQNIYKKINTPSVLIIDEVSMLRASVLDAVDTVCRRVRRSPLPFGGLQVVFCGDFFQLPPVIRERAVTPEDFAFSSKSWKEANPVICYLTENYRQQDNSLNTILNSIRSGELDYDLLETLNETIDRDLSKVNHVKLYSHNADVDSINNKNYAELDNNKKENKEYLYYMTSTGNKNIVEKLKASCLSPEILKLKIGAKVMFTRNDKYGKYNNGSIGEVTGYRDDELDTPIILLNNGKKIEVVSDSWRIEEDGKVKAQISQLPLRYAWAITIHKSQGMTLDAAEIDLSKSFGYALGYVALSRVRDIDGIKLLGANPNAFSVHPHMHKVDTDLRSRSTRAIEALKKYDDEKLKDLHDTFAGKSKKEIKIEINTFEETKKLALEKSSDSKSTSDSKSKISEYVYPTISAIADKRDLTIGTIITHIEVLLEEKQINKKDIEDLIKNSLDKKFKTEKFLAFIEDEFKKSEGKLAPVKAVCDKQKINTTFDELKVLKLLFI